jgi:hypothetical protein
LDVSDNEIGDDGIRIICDNIYYRYVDEAEGEALKNCQGGIEIPQVLEKKPKAAVEIAKTKVEGLKILKMSNCKITCKSFLLLRKL